MENLHSIDLEQLAEIELQKDEEEQAQLCGDAVDSPTWEANDVSISHPYYGIACHGIIHVAGDDNSGRKAITFSCCRLPPCHEIDHVRLLEALFHPLKVLEAPNKTYYNQWVLFSNIQVTLAGVQLLGRGTKKTDHINASLRGPILSSLCGPLYSTHPFSLEDPIHYKDRPLISTVTVHKFGKKVLYMNYLSDLRDHLRFNRLIFPHEVLQHDEKLCVRQKGRPPPASKAPPPRPPLPTQ
ncbi:TORC2 signaling [Pristimantis euphronides]